MSATTFIQTHAARRQLRVLLAGASGYVGRAVRRALEGRGFEVVPLSRHGSTVVDEETVLDWDTLREKGLPVCDFVVNTCGSPIFEPTTPWGDHFKAELESSRIETTRLLADMIRKAEHKPLAFVNASWTAYYPHSRSAVYDESYVLPTDPTQQLSLSYWSRMVRSWEHAATVDDGSSAARAAPPVSREIDATAAFRSATAAAQAQAASAARTATGAAFPSASPAAPPSSSWVPGRAPAVPSSGAASSSFYETSPATASAAADAAAASAASAAAAEQARGVLLSGTPLDAAPYSQPAHPGPSMASWGLRPGQRFAGLHEESMSGADMGAGKRLESSPRLLASGDTHKLSNAQVRVVNLRLGTCLSSQAPLLHALRAPLQWGLLMPCGDGRQKTPWIHVEDAANAFVHAIANEALEGPVNVVAPEVATNEELTRGISRAAGVVSLPFHYPESFINNYWGPVRAQLFLESTHVVPTKLDDSGFKFKYPSLDSCLHSMRFHK